MQFKASVIAINSSGSTVSFTNTSKIWKVGGLFYCNIGGTLFSSNNGVVFNQIGFVQPISSSNRTTTVEYASGLAIGSLQSRALGNGSATMTIALDNNLTQGTIASFFKLNNDTAFTTSTGSGMTSLLYKTPMNTSTQFIVPYLPATSINQTNCIVAR